MKARVLRDPPLLDGIVGHAGKYEVGIVRSWKSQFKVGEVQRCSDFLYRHIIAPLPCSVWPWTCHSPGVGLSWL